jgi:hypothetical protein
MGTAAGVEDTSQIVAPILKSSLRALVVMPAKMAIANKAALRRGPEVSVGLYFIGDRSTSEIDG